MDWLKRLRGKSDGPTDLGFLAVDMHSHVLPGIDDGAPDVATAVELVRTLRALGYSEIIATPHVMGELYLNTPDTIGQSLAALRTGLREAGVEMPVSAAAEYMLDDHFTGLLGSGTDLLTLDGKRLLLELPQAGELPGWREVIFQLQTRGYRVVLAHPERYRYLAGRPSIFDELSASGVELQVNLLSLLGYYGPTMKRTGNDLLARGLVHFLGTDLHHERHAQALRQLIRKRRLLGKLTSVGSHQRKLLHA